VPTSLCKSFIGSLKAGFVTERSELGSCRAFSVQYPILIDGWDSPSPTLVIKCLSRLITAEYEFQQAMDIAGESEGLEEGS